MLGEIHVGLLNDRITEFVAQADILLENQMNVDSAKVITLFTLVDQNVNKKHTDFSLSFLDIKKAFDKNKHARLWNKLIQYKIYEKFARLIKSLYERVRSCVSPQAGLTGFFMYKRGVRQGCPALHCYYCKICFTCTGYSSKNYLFHTKL